jgi:hypothetical protein
MGGRRRMKRRKNEKGVGRGKEGLYTPELKAKPEASLAVG